MDRTPGRGGDGLRTINVKSRSACTRCNEGWMSRAEQEAMPLLAQIIRGKPARWGQPDQRKVARWVMKTALMLDRSSVASRVAPAEHFSFVYEKQAPPASAVVYLAKYFPVGEAQIGVLASSFRPTGVDPRLYPNPYQITFSVGQAIFQVFGHSGTAPLEIRRARYRQSRLIVPVVDQFRQLWPVNQLFYEWPPQCGHLGTHNLQVLARF